MSLHKNAVVGLIVALSFLALIGISHATDIRRSPVVRAVEASAPAVVNISTEQTVQRRSPFGSIGDPLFDRFFNDFFEGQGNYTRTSLGSGVIFRKDGYILTNEHVILRASKITVILMDGREFEAKVIGSDSSSDLAILKIEANNLPILRPGSSDDLMIGETAIAIGNPFGLSNTVTTGVVSAVHRSFRAGENRIYSDFIQTDASINPGNSGGALLNIKGELIGINTAIYGSAQGIGFSIPIDRAMRIVDNLIEFGKVRHGWIGVRVANLDFRSSKATGVRPGKGILVTKIFSGSPAENANIRPGDVIVGLDGINIGSVEQYRAAVLNITVDTELGLELQRNGEPKTVTITARELPKSVAERFGWELIGIKVRLNNAKVAESYNAVTHDGLMVTQVAANSSAGKLGLRPGDVILGLGGRNMDSLDAFYAACGSLRLAESAIIVVQRGSRAYYLSLALS